MSRTSLIGALGLARQSAKDVLATPLVYVPATSISLEPQQNTQTLPPEVGGSYFLRGSYKASVTGAGDIGLVVRPNSFGQFLMGLCGQDTATGVSGQSGAYSHVFTPFTPAAGVDLPWFSYVKDISKLKAIQFLNTKVRSLRLDIPKASITTAQIGVLATTPSFVTPASLGTETFDTTPPFQTVQATISLTPEGSGSNISANSIKMERFSLNLANNLSEDEFSVGSPYLDDVTLLQKTATVDMDVIIRDTALHDAVYSNGSAAPSTWDPTVYRGALTITLTSGVNVPTTTQPYSLQAQFPGLDFLMMPISLSGADLVRATLSTQVTLGTSGTDRYTFTLINGIASY